MEARKRGQEARCRSVQRREASEILLEVMAMQSLLGLAPVVTPCQPLGRAGGGGRQQRLGEKRNAIFFKSLSLTNLIAAGSSGPHYRF